MSSVSEQFDRRGRHIGMWRNHANDLRKAARLVWEGGKNRLQAPGGSSHEIQELYRPAQLLMGLCLEVALKGLLVERDPDLVSGGKLPRALTTHSLEDLFLAANIPLTDTAAELHLVRKLSDGVEWIARYPIPTKADKLRSAVEMRRSSFVKHNNDFERFEALWQRIRDKDGTTSDGVNHSSAPNRDTPDFPYNAV